MFVLILLCYTVKYSQFELNAKCHGYHGSICAKKGRTIFKTQPIVQRFAKLVSTSSVHNLALNWLEFFSPEKVTFWARIYISQLWQHDLMFKTKLCLPFMSVSIKRNLSDHSIESIRLHRCNLMLWKESQINPLFSGNFLHPQAVHFLLTRQIFPLNNNASISFWQCRISF